MLWHLSKLRWVRFSSGCLLFTSHAMYTVRLPKHPLGGTLS